MYIINLGTLFVLDQKTFLYSFGILKSSNIIIIKKYKI